jgi:hypothetical protein
MTKPRKKSEERVSLSPLKPVDALKALLATPQLEPEPKPKPKRQRRKRRA